MVAVRSYGAAPLYRLAQQGAAYTVLFQQYFCVTGIISHIDTLPKKLRSLTGIHTCHNYGTWHATLTLSSKRADFHRPLWQSLGVHNNYT